MYAIKSERHQRTLNKYISSVLNNEFVKYINKIYLYGSCARNEQTFYSDIDLFVVLKEDINVNTREAKESINDDEFWKVKSVLSGECMLCVSDAANDADIDIHYTKNSEWYSANDFFYEQIRKDCILLWERNKN